MSQINANDRFIHNFGQAMPTTTYRTDGVGPVSAGDLVMWDTTLKRLTSTNGSKFVGVAQDAIPLASTIDSAFTPTDIPVAVAGVFAFTGTAGDTYAHNDAVYPAANAQSVTKTQAGGTDAIIGYVHSPLGATFSGAVTNVPIRILPQKPVAGIPV